MVCMCSHTIVYNSRNNYLSFILLETSMDHLETKKRMLALREKFGKDNWLSCHAGTFVQDIMGLHSASQPAASPITNVKALADINVASSLHDSLIYMMDSEQSSSELKTQQVVEHVEDEKNNVPEEENEIREEQEEISVVSPETIYDPKEGEY